MKGNWKREICSNSIKIDENLGGKRWAWNQWVLDWTSLKLKLKRKLKLFTSVMKFLFNFKQFNSLVKHSKLLFEDWKLLTKQLQLNSSFSNFHEKSIHCCQKQNNYSRCRHTKTNSISIFHRSGTAGEKLLGVRTVWVANLQSGLPEQH